jgi:hypothetical protein
MTAARRHLRGLRATLDGDTATAESNTREALAIFRRLDLPPEIAVALTDLLRIVGSDHPEAAAIEAEIREISRRLGAATIVRRLDAGPLSAPRAFAASPAATPHESSLHAASPAAD